jgi:hypothetical protein
MPTVTPPPGLEDKDYETIEAAVMETARGRWFLLEHARRTRETETAGLALALASLEDLVRRQAELRDRDRDRRLFIDIAGAIEERLLDLSWSLRSRGIEPAVCELIDREAARLRLSVLAERDFPKSGDVTVLAMEQSRETSAVGVSAPATVLSEDLPVENDTAQATAADVPVDVPPPLKPERLAVLDGMTPTELFRIFA